jgi:hypothetical protein
VHAFTTDQLASLASDSPSYSLIHSQSPIESLAANIVGSDEILKNKLELLVDPPHPSLHS